MPTASEPATDSPPGPATPSPARVPGNDWTAIDVADVGRLDARERVAVLVSGPDPGAALPLTLAALAGQSYPAELTEVIVESSGGIDEDALRGAADVLEPTVVATGQEARSAAALERAAIVVLLEAGVVPERELVEAHARWHHAVADAVSVGATRRSDLAGVEAGAVSAALEAGGLEPLLAGSGGEPHGGGGRADPALGELVEATRGLTERRSDLFRIVGRGSIGLRADTLRAAERAAAATGGPESIGPSGPAGALLARLDLGYRLECHGCVFVPEDGAIEYAAEPARAAPAAGGPAFDAPAASLLPVPHFRPAGTGRLFERPGLVVTVPAHGESAADVLDTVDATLRGRRSDLAVHVDVPGEHPEAGRIAQACAEDPRVTVGSAGAGASAAPYRLTLPPTVVPGPGSLAAVHALIDGASLGALEVTVASARRLPVRAQRWAGRLLPHATVGVAATGPLARAERIAAASRREPAAVLAELFGKRRVDGAAVGIRARGEPESDPRENGTLGPATDLAHERAEHLRYRARAATNQARLDRQSQRLYRERLRANHERTRAERLEARLARVSPPYWVGWKSRRVARRVAAQPRRAWRRLARIREPLYRARLRARAALGRGSQP